MFAILHNLAYGLLMLMFGQGFWGETGDEPVFFILAIIICPLAFLVGSIGSLVVSGKQKKKVKK
ncbi:TPA: hypothetical protein HA265_07105 [Candidatus Woesearchaeota archaeon]|nr:hypothetical protein [Candidatus Woesearchaeota archaeon]